MAGQVAMGLPGQALVDPAALEFQVAGPTAERPGPGFKLAGPHNLFDGSERRLVIDGLQVSDGAFAQFSKYPLGYRPARLDQFGAGGGPGRVVHRIGATGRPHGQSGSQQDNRAEHR